MNDASPTNNCSIPMTSVFMLTCCDGDDYSVEISTKRLGGARGDGNISNDILRDPPTTNTASAGGTAKADDSVEGMNVIGYVRMKSEDGEPPSSSGKIRSSPFTTPATTPRAGNYKRTERMEYSASRADVRSNPFASSPLVYRGDQSFLDQCSLLSLIDPDTAETSPSTEMEEMMMMRQQQHSTSTPIFTPKGRQQKSHHPDHIATKTPTRSISSSSVMMGKSSSPLPPDSPMMELSMAKQCANVAQNFRKHNREMWRNHRTIDGIGKYSPTTPSKKSRDGSSVGSCSTTTRTPHATPPKLPPTRGGGDENGLRTSSAVSGKESEAVTPNSNASTQDTMSLVIRPYLQFEDATPPPLWTESTASTPPDINPELILTYKYPRLYLQDPANVIAGQFSNNRETKRLWWFQLAQRMNTTLEHVQDGHWKELLRLQQLRNSSNNTLCSESSASALSNSEGRHLFCSTLKDGSKAMSELCLGKQHQRVHHRLKKETSSTIGSGEDPATAGHTAALFQPGACPQNKWSEPSASTMNVRGKTYLKDDIKVASETSIFSVLGVDSFVSDGKGNEDVSWATNNFLQRWNVACEDVGLVRPPFLLIINFIVPWGDFQVYLTRPDADEGPFSSRRKSHASEILWREFMEGSTEYRNKCFKLIPSVCAGPWMVKKMVGSTPALAGSKVPTSYRGSINENYLEIILDVKSGSAFGSNVANAVVGKADAVAVDIGFVIEGQVDGHLPEQMLGLVRLHRLNMQTAPTHSQWNQEISTRAQSCLHLRL